ncbi:MAG: type IV toxin-antitoxin system AbiEi family antitoxin domain-containing protein [Solirubrobacteraceae bacterium]
MPIHPRRGPCARGLSTISPIASEIGQPSRERAISRLAARQHGNVTRRQLLALSFSDQAIRLRVAGGRLHRVHAGVYAVGRPPVTALERAGAAVLACGDGAALSHFGALALWELRGRWPLAFDVTVVGGHPRPPGIRVHRCPSLTTRDLRTHRGIRATSLARAILDCAPVLADRQLTRLVNEGLLTAHLSRSKLADVRSRFHTHAGARLLARFVEHDDGPTRSQMEDRFLALCAQHGLPRPRINVVVAGHEVDALFEAQKLIVELDGWRFHRERSSFESDRSRDADTLLAGFRTLRLTWQRMTGRPAQVAAQLRVLLGLAV